MTNKKDTVYLIYYNYLNEDRATVSIGGIQTYLHNLCQVIISMGLEPIVIQLAKENFEVTYCGYPVVGISTNRAKFPKKAISRVPKGSAVVFGTHELIVPFDGMTIGIQHGITWDTPVHRELSKKLNNLYVFQRARMGYRLLRQLSHVDTLVCVDNNFINWYRTQVAYPSVSMVSIPNFSKIVPPTVKTEGCINIMFARRLFWYRGTRIFIEAAKRLLEEYGERLHITVAGSGDDEAYMRGALGTFENVEFIRYAADESLDIHKDKHIAVVPTVGSEGTSLSLLEAMASKCAVICTNVGGMTNIVIDGYNGLMINPNEDDLYQALKRFVEDQELRNTLSERAFDTVVNAFSHKKWEEKWKSVIEECLYD